MNYFNFEDIFVTSKLKSELEENSLLEKIVFVVLSLYVLATEYRFIEHQEKSTNPFYKYLLHYHHNPKIEEDESLTYLSLGVEIAFLYTTEKFPIIN